MKELKKPAPEGPTGSGSWTTMWNPMWLALKDRWGSGRFQNVSIPGSILLMARLTNGKDTSAM